jgi:hypothetical protein
MSKNANEIVAKLLEYGGTYGDGGAGGGEERPGGPADMWRQGGYQKFDIRGMDTGGRRPGEPANMPEEPELPDTDAPTLSPEERAIIDRDNAQRAPGRSALPGNRFQWKPPQA